MRRLIFLLILCSSCGYHLGHGGVASQYRTISVPYVNGDWNGELTSYIIKELEDNGELKYVPSGGDLILNVSILDTREEEISFRYDKKKSGAFKKSIIPDENRVYLTVQVDVVDALTGEFITGPARIAAFVEFDHDYYSVRHGVNVFSLGQLIDIDEARESAQKPLFIQTAKKITAFVLDNW